MYINWVIHCFVEKSPNDHFHLRFGAKMTLERWQHQYFNFTQIGRSASKNILTLAIFVALCVNGDQSKMGKKHFWSSLSKVYMPVTQEILKISQYHFKLRFLINFSFVIFIFKTLYGSMPEIFQRIIVEYYPFSVDVGCFSRSKQLYRTYSEC